jgi:hypothetical protein
MGRGVKLALIYKEQNERLQQAFADFFVVLKQTAALLHIEYYNFNYNCVCSIYTLNIIISIIIVFVQSQKSFGRPVRSLVPTSIVLLAVLVVNMSIDYTLIIIIFSPSLLLKKRECSLITSFARPNFPSLH